MSDTTDPVYVLDEIELHPGALEPFLSALARDYEPHARARGMERIHTWVTPPIEIEGRGNEVLVVWRLADAEGFWAARSRSADPEVLEFWKACEGYIVARTRRYAAESSALPALDAAGRQNA